MNWLLSLAVLILLPPMVAAGQDTLRERGTQLLAESKYAEAERLFAEWTDAEPRSAEANYLHAVSLASLGRLSEARAGFLRVLALDSSRADAQFEMAATFLTDRQYPTALDWTMRGLRQQPDDEYGLDLTATILFVSGQKVEALRYWNRIHRPSLSDLRIRVSGGITREAVAAEIPLAPGDLLTKDAIEQARWRLSQYKFLRNVVFDPIPGQTPQQYDLDVVVEARHGVGTVSDLLFSTLADAWFRTLGFNYWNIGHSGLSLSVRGRWLSTAQRGSVELDAPRPAHLPLYLSLSYAWRNESWTLSDTDEGFRVRAHTVALTSTFPIRLPNLSLAATIASRSRAYEPIGPATGDGGVGPPAGAFQRANEGTRGVVWFRAVPRLTFSESNFVGDLSLRGQVRGGVEVGFGRGRMQSGMSRLSVSSDARIERTGGGAQQSLTLGVHAGRTSGAGLAEDHFVLGVGPDAEFSLRAHPYSRNGRLGVPPLAGEFRLANATVAIDVATIGWFKVGAVAFADLARVPRLYGGRALPGTLLDVGVGVELGSALLSSRRVTLAWARDTRAGRSTFYVATSLR